MVSMTCRRRLGFHFSLSCFSCDGLLAGRPLRGGPAHRQCTGSAAGHLSLPQSLRPARPPLPCSRYISTSLLIIFLDPTLFRSFPMTSGLLSISYIYSGRYIDLMFRCVYLLHLTRLCCELLLCLLVRWVLDETVWDAGDNRRLMCCFTSALWLSITGLCLFELASCRRIICWCLMSARSRHHALALSFAISQSTTLLVAVGWTTEAIGPGYGVDPTSIKFKMIHLTNAIRTLLRCLYVCSMYACMYV
jgi:hypothetical protein